MAVIVLPWVTIAALGNPVLNDETTISTSSFDSLATSTPVQLTFPKYR